MFRFIYLTQDGTGMEGIVIIFIFQAQLEGGFGIIYGRIGVAFLI